jgi:hypothetical protein
MKQRLYPLRIVGNRLMLEADFEQLHEYLHEVASSGTPLAQLGVTNFGRFTAERFTAERRTSSLASVRAFNAR